MDISKFIEDDANSDDHVDGVKDAPVDLKTQVALCDRLHNAGDPGAGAARDELVTTVTGLMQEKADDNKETLIATVAELASKEADGPEIQETLTGLIEERRITVPAAAAEPLAGAKLVARDPPPREWLIHGWIPYGRLCSLYGMGGAGKSRLALQMAAAVMEGGIPIVPDATVMGTDKQDLEATGMGQSREGGRRVLWLSWEDERDEFIRRWRMAYWAGAVRTQFPNMGRLTLVDMRKVGGPLWAPEGTGHVANRATWTEAGERFLASMKGHALAVVDPIAAAYASSENDRALVRAFAAALDGAAEQAGCAVLLIGHPPKGAAGDGYSGSTDWRNAVRSMMVLEISDGTGHTISVREDGKDKTAKARAWRLRLDKASYAKEGGHIWLAHHYQEDESVHEGQVKRLELAWFACTAAGAAAVYNPERVEAIGAGANDKSTASKPDNKRAASQHQQRFDDEDEVV